MGATGVGRGGEDGWGGGGEVGNKGSWEAKRGGGGAKQGRADNLTVHVFATQHHLALTQLNSTHLAA